jgi:hypothetical protein
MSTRRRSAHEYTSSLEETQKEYFTFRKQAPKHREGRKCREEGLRTISTFGTRVLPNVFEMARGIPPVLDTDLQQEEDEEVWKNTPGQKLDPCSQLTNMLLSTK